MVVVLMMMMRFALMERFPLLKAGGAPFLFFSLFSFRDGLLPMHIRYPILLYGTLEFCHVEKVQTYWFAHI